MNPTTTTGGVEDDCNIIDTPIFKNKMEYLSDKNIKLASGEKVIDKINRRLNQVQLEREADEQKHQHKSKS